MIVPNVQVVEDAIRILGELDEDQYVYITGADNTWLNQLDRRFNREGLDGVRFVTIEQIQQGILRGCKGVLIIDDMHHIPWDQKEQILSEQRVMNRSYLDTRAS